ncbi:helix-turn-helix domain-containing protein [Mucilaginibacter sp.]|jgi:AraC-like DNA-binding protein|uniref:helix-turn-helix domain-containing protein n=1 Tax=Mucilaginibacter sp. TaxID=1882438 RepID=UPI003564AAA4
MPESKYFLFFVGALGAFNGLMLGIYFLCFVKKKNLSSFFLGCLLAALSIRIGKSVFVYFDPALPKIYLQIGLSACLLIGPALFFFIKSAIEQPASLPRNWKLQIIALIAVMLIAGILFPYAIYPKLWNLYFIKMIYTAWLVYVIAAGLKLKNIFARLGSDPASVKTAEKWLAAIFSTNAVILAFFLMAALFRNVFETYYGGAVIFSFVLYGMIFVHLYKAKTTDQFYLIPGKPNKKTNNVNTSLLLRSLEQAMTVDVLFKNPNLMLSELAKVVNLTSHQLSQILNDDLGKNFTSYVNEYRINEACRMMAKGHPFSLEAIGYEVGFNSKSTFYAAFKKLKSTTPMLYKEELTKSNQVANASLSVK